MTDSLSQPDQMLRRTSTVMGSEVADGVIVMDIESGSYFSFNETGSAIWRALEAPVTPEQIVVQLCDRFEIDAAHCRAKVSEFLDHLKQNRIVEAVPAA